MLELKDFSVTQSGPFVAFHCLIGYVMVSLNNCPEDKEKPWRCNCYIVGSSHGICLSGEPYSSADAALADFNAHAKQIFKQLSDEDMDDIFDCWRDEEDDFVIWVRQVGPILFRPPIPLAQQGFEAPYLFVNDAFGIKVETSEPGGGQSVMDCIFNIWEYIVSEEDKYLTKEQQEIKARWVAGTQTWFDDNEDFGKY